MMRFHRLVSLFALGAVAVGAGTLATRAAGPALGSTELATETVFAPEARAAAKDEKPTAQRRSPVPVVGYPVHFGITPAVRDLPPAEVKYAKPGSEGREIINPSMGEKSRKPPLKRVLRASDSGDGALYSPASPLGGMSPPGLTFETLSNADNVPLVGGQVYPPDTNGDIGPNHYVQSVNIVMRIYNRLGVPAGPPFLMSSLFAAVGAPCGNRNDGDPIVLYDHLADRWLISQFALPTFPDPPFYQCIAISQTGDPTGAYFAYSFTMPGNNLNDYPHFGVWPDAYYMTDNQFLAPGFAFNGGGAFAFDRAAMLAGNPAASFIYFDLQLVDPNIGGQLPSDLDGPPPLPGRPNVFAMFTATEFGDPQGDGLRLWEFTPNFVTPASSTFVELPALPVAAFDPISPAGRSDIPQPGTAIGLDSIADRIMHRLQYRNFGTHESLTVNHTVDASGDPGAAVFRAGVRYYELRRSLPGGAWTVREQATYAPADGIHRWMGSAAMDREGNLAVGYSVSAPTVTFPGIRYAGRLANDPLGGLMQGEQLLIAGGGRVQTGSANRWGDYSNLSVDPVDDCTFWYTQEYYGPAPAPAACGAGTICWNTRVGNFRFPSCSPAGGQGQITGTVRDALTTNPISGALVMATGGFSASTTASGVYSLNVPPGTYDVTASKPPTYAAQTITGQVVTAGGTTTVDFNLVGGPNIIFESRTIDDSGGNNNGNVDPDECIGMNVVLRNNGGGSATNVSATLSTVTPNVTVTQATSTYPDITTTATNDTPFQFETSPAFVPGTVINFTLNITTTQGPFTVTFTVPSGTVNPTGTNFNSTAPVPIPDFAGGVPGVANVPITVSGITSSIAKVRVSTRITHTWDGDLILSLIGPDATTVVLSNRRGGSADNYGTDCPADDGDDTIFDDAAATAIGTGTAPFVGSFRPEAPLAAYNGKTGAAVNGTWTFRVSDNEGADVGVVECVTITINDFLTASGGGGCSAQVSINDVTVAEGAGNATFNVTLSSPATGTITVDYATSDGTATAGADYTSTTGTLTFTAGQSTQPVTVPILNDALDEVDETFNVDLSNVTGPGIILDAQGVGTITDDDPAPTISIGDLAQAEGNTGSTPFTSFMFPITLSAPSGKLVTLRFDTSDGTATAPSDYETTGANLTFQLGQTAVAAAVNVVGDRLDEPNETFNVDLTNPTNATIADNQGVGTINDDDTSYYSVTPCRLHDTRLPTPNPLVHNTTRNFAMTGACNVPATAAAVHVIVTTVAQSHVGDLRAWPTGQAEPTTSIINYSALHNRANNMIIPLGTGGQITVKPVLVNPAGTTHVVLDVLGYFK